jgi:hypothetical protein
MMMTVDACFAFKEDVRGNRLDKLPSYLRELVESEYSPVRTYLETVEPGCFVRIKISVEVAASDRSVAA